MTRPPPGAYDPLVSVESPGGKPEKKPRFRVLINKSHWRAWERMIQAVGAQSAQRLWNHLAHSADQPPLVGQVTRMKGGHMKATGGWSAVHHYEVSGAGRVDFRYHHSFTGGATGEPHGVVQVIRVDLSSH